MATSAEVQTALDSAYGPNVIKISHDMDVDATYHAYYATSIQEATKGKAHYCRVTIANSAADQATEIYNSLALEGHSDANLR